MFKRPIRETVAAFPAHESQLAGIRKTVEEICLEANLGTREINNIILAVEEGATNIIRHAYMLGKGEIRLKVGVFKYFVIFSLFDTGKSFQPPDKTRLDLKKMADTGRKGGLGFYLINKVMDRVEYFSLEGENELRMTKFFSKEAEEKLQFGGGLSLRVKFSAWTFLIILFLVTGGFLYIDSLSTRFIQSRLDKTVNALCNTIASLSHEYIVTSRTDAEFDKLVDSYMRANDLLKSIVVVDPHATIIADSREQSRLYLRYQEESISKLYSLDELSLSGVTDNKPYIMRKIEFAGSNLGTVIVKYSSEVMEAELKKTKRIIFIITAIGLIVGITGIYLLSNYFVRPIGRIVGRVRRFAQGDLESQLPLTGAGEFYEISKALNELIMRIRRDRKNVVEREILQKEMEMAEQIQKALIPGRPPQMPSIQIGTIYKAARMVGGDLFDFIPIDEHTLGVVVADVSGKGVPGSLVMSMVRTAVRLESRGNHSARDILIKVNDFVAHDIKKGMFVTVLLALIDTSTGKINFVSAGHNPLIHFRYESKEAQLINAPGMPVGIKADNSLFGKALKEEHINLKTNDILLLYTDGVTEGRGKQKKTYGTDSMIQILKDNSEKGAIEIAQLIEADIMRFMGKTDQHDDITMVVLKNVSVNKSDRSDQKSKADTKAAVDAITVKHERPGPETG